MEIKLTGIIDFDEFKSEITEDLKVYLEQQIKSYFEANLKTIVGVYLKENPIEPKPKKKITQNTILTDAGTSISILQWSIDTQLPVRTLISRKQKGWSDYQTINTTHQHHRIDDEERGI